MKGGRKRPWWRCLAFIGVIIVLIVTVPLIAIEGFCRAPFPAALNEVANTGQIWPAVNEAAYKRPEANTYLTFPEWYIVYSFEDFGRFLERGNESGFPYARHILGFWRSFCIINRITAQRTDVTFDVKLMIYVIGISYSVEYGIKGLYENSVGRIFEWARGPQRTAEDIYARNVAQDYGQFLYTIPWYKYPFFEKLRGLWAEPFGRASILRSAERRFELTAEWTIKTGYAWLIAKALDVSGDDEARDIMLVVAPLSQEMLAKEPRIRVVRALDAEHQLILIPRYKDFTEIVKEFAKDNRKVFEVAGNRSIMLTAILPEGDGPKIGGLRRLFCLPLGAKPGSCRAAFDVKVDRLTSAINELEAAQVTVEHLYDY